MNEGFIYGCGEFGLKEYELTKDGKIKTEISIIGTALVLILRRSGDTGCARGLQAEDNLHEP